MFKTLSDFCMKRGEQLQNIVKNYRAARDAGFTEQQRFLDKWNDLIKSYTTYIKPRYAPLSLKAFLTVAKSFFNFWKIPIDVQLPRHTYVLWHNRDLTKEIIKQILSKASQRNRTIWLLMAESGLRGNTAINLRYWQIKEDFEKATVPMRILTPSESLKDHVGDRWSFVGEDGFKALKEYLEPRMPLKDHDFVFTSENPEKMKGEQFTVASLSTLFRKTVRALKLEKGLSRLCPLHTKKRKHG